VFTIFRYNNTEGIVVFLNKVVGDILLAARWPAFKLIRQQPLTLQTAKEGRQILPCIEKLYAM
jgi:hypothetical protein